MYLYSERCIDWDYGLFYSASCRPQNQTQKNEGSCATERHRSDETIRISCEY